VKTNGTDNIEKGTIIAFRTSTTPKYSILLENGKPINAEPNDILPEGTSPDITPSIALGFFTPDWLKQDYKVTLLHKDKYKRGYLILDADNDW